VGLRAEFGLGQEANAARRSGVRTLSCGARQRGSFGTSIGFEAVLVAASGIRKELCRFDLRWETAFHIDSLFEFAIKPWMNGGIL
jgi:hypothetical protein